MRLGKEVRLIVTGVIVAKGYKLERRGDDDLSYACTVKVAAVEAGGIA